MLYIFTDTGAIQIKQNGIKWNVEYPYKQIYPNNVGFPFKHFIIIYNKPGIRRQKTMIFYLILPLKMLFLLLKNPINIYLN